MAKGSTLHILLESDHEPTLKSYNQVVEDTIKKPQQISGLTDDTVRDDILISLTTHSHRLAHFFRLLRSAVRPIPKSPIASTIATETVFLLVRMLPHLHQLLETTKVLELLIPALDICFASIQRPTLQELASVLAEAGPLLEYISSDRLGSEILRQWTCTPNPLALDAQTLESWTQRFVKMVGSCRKNHDVAQAIQQWSSLNTLKASLQSMKDSHLQHSKNDSGLVARHELPSLGRMTQLRKEDKKARAATRQNFNTSLPPLPDRLKGYLKAFDLQIPGSINSLLDVIKRLEGDKTTAILLSIATSFPCNLCILGLECSPEAQSAESDDQSIGPVPNLQIETLNKKIGIWKVLLSPQALRSLLHMGSHGVAHPATEMLETLASGSWVPPAQLSAASKSQKKDLKVPLESTECGKDHSILWQIYIGFDDDMEVLQQMIIVWEVCKQSEISKIIDRVIFIQGSYSDETVNRCRQHSSTHDGKQIPARFNDPSLPSPVSAKLLADHDRIVDQDIIDMTNKFYALTEPVMRSILFNDLSAEFPFEISKEEARVIGHFQTASLILGRSGTGKTTCLVYKLVRKYLASKAVIGERPVRQILLTRSSFLAEKLRSYARNLIDTLSSKALSLELSEQKEFAILMTREEVSDKESVLTMRDESFPQVCTWDHFLRVLENTTRIWHRQDFPELVGEIVDFYNFEVKYWPRFPKSLTKDSSVNLVFAEIMGVIKGSASSAQSLAPLRRKEYLARSCRMAPTFAMEAERSRVYDLFELYETLKVRRGDMDYVDRVVRVLRAVRGDSSLMKEFRSKFEEVYIDEVQDQRCLDIELLLSFVKDPRGFHFAGDTAQAISQDATFKFSDIKGMFFHHFAAVSISTRQHDLARPELFTLSKNYRSHQGILSLASLVMGMIWQGFPETVDKLEPEIGSLGGPKPVLFIGVDASILRSSNVGHATLLAGTADFGAEQAILVRDTIMKRALQNHIGEVALIFTILESKGMEFDDVILWNFFTDCPDQAGVRSLDALKNDPAKFDPKKHGGMCSELKNLYVAVTRARSQLFIVEGSETTAATVLKLLAHDSSKPLIEATHPGQEDFAMKLDLLRPASSVDPVGWRRRGEACMRHHFYRDARMCFRNAEYARGETVAAGHIWEADGDSCYGNNDPEGFTRNLGVAVECFLKAELIEEAARVLVRMGKLEDTAELWSRHDNHAKAAHFFAKAGLYAKAIDSHHNAREYSEAAAMLQRERNYDQLVSYLNQNRDNIPANTLQGHSLLCKLLLKQNRLSLKCRKYAIDLLGSSAEQEACFIEYGMDEELANLYSSQHRHEDLFHLCSRKGKLERALSLVITKDLLHLTADGLESEVLSLLDYVWAGHLEKNRLQRSTVPLKLPSGFLTPNVILRAEQWEASNLVYSLENSIARHHVASMQSTVPRTVLCLRKILDATVITQVTNLDDLPFEMMQEAVKFARNLIVDKSSDTLKTVLLLIGLWKPDNGQEGSVVLPWSPLRETLTDASNIHSTKVAMQWFLDRLVTAILALDAKARDLWKEKWPKRCVQFMTVAFCPRMRNGAECHWLHRLVNADDCSGMLDDLLRINSIFCDLAVLYTRRSMNGIFQEKYMGIKRHWLERLLRELTHLSSVEQNTSAIARTQVELFREKNFHGVSSFLEDLLYFRLGKEWEQRSNFTSLLEQMQLSKAFGSNVQYSFFRALSNRLRTDHRDLLQSHLGLLNSLKDNFACWNASIFQANLMIFLGNLRRIEVPALSTLHALTAVLECLVAYLVLKLCITACLIPSSWIDLHVTSIGKAIHSSEPLHVEDKHRYQQCLIHLGNSFCEILSRLNNAVPPLPPDFLLCSGYTYPALLLRQRNAELVALVVANLAATSPEPPIGFNDVWTKAKEVFEYDFVKAFHLRSRTPNELIQKLAPSLAKYNGKDALVVVFKDRKKGHAFSNLERQPGVRTILFDQLFPRAPDSAVADDSAYQHALPTSTDGAHEQYSAAETEAMIKIQRLWRSCSLKIKKRHSYVSVPECRVTARFFNLVAQCPITVTSGNRTAIRKLLVSHGVALSLRLGTAKGLLSKLKKDSETCIENVEISQGVDESVDDIIRRNRDVEGLLDKAEEKMSDECVAGLVKLGVLQVLEKAIKDVEGILAEAEQVMLKTRKILDAVV